MFIYLLLLCSPILNASDFEVDGIYYRIIGDIAVEVSGSDCAGNIIIPETVIYEDIAYIVTDIGFEAFSNCTELTSVEIPNSVTTIGDYAFHGCTSLTNIEIPNSVKEFKRKHLLLL